VISAQKACWPVALGDRGCASVPDSILQQKLFSPQTDIIAKGLPTGRYRYLNSACVMGTVADLKPLFERAEQYLIQGLHDYLRKRPRDIRSYFRRAGGMAHDNSGKRPGNRNVKTIIQLRQLRGRQELCEFSIGLDYESLLVLSTNGDNGATRSIRYNDPEGITVLSK